MMILCFFLCCVTPYKSRVVGNTVSYFGKSVRNKEEGKDNGKRKLETYLDIQIWPLNIALSFSSNLMLYLIVMVVSRRGDSQRNFKSRMRCKYRSIITSHIFENQIFSQSFELANTSHCHGDRQMIIVCFLSIC